MNDEEHQRKDRIWKFVLEHQELSATRPPRASGSRGLG